jgi:malto-oligosyltrehalose trehalohydrolase
MPYGSELQRNGRVRFRLWAPAYAHITLRLERADLPMVALADGWHELRTDRAEPGARYRFVLPDGTMVPDPASRYQPDDVHGPSEVVDPTAYDWRDKAWVTPPWPTAVIYELHVGAFTAEGSFSAAATKLDHLVRLGVTAVELMPVADFPGRRNWGYDGVLPFAPDASYGRPEALKQFVDAAHARGLMVLLDVVYNHLGPEGNYLGQYAPQFFTERHHTPWGAAINYDGADAGPVRDFFIHNALYWLEEFHLDGLRLDAVHAIIDEGERHFLHELAERVRTQYRAAHLLLENEDNKARWLVRDANGIARLFDAQWNDDLHHVLHVAATVERQGYYADYPAGAAQLGRVFAEGFAFQGELMRYRGSGRGEPSAQLPPCAFVAFIQNHDQIGNRAFGERLGTMASSAAMRALSATYLLLPQIPMLFMGEEWNAAQPFTFFSDLSGELGRAVRDGRRQEFARFPEFQDEGTRARIPDPQADATFSAAKLDWSDCSRAPHERVLDWYARLLAIRRQSVVPMLPALTRAGEYTVLGERAVRVRWRAPTCELVLTANLSVAEATSPGTFAQHTLLEVGEIGIHRLGAWSVHWGLNGEAAP